MCLRAGHEGFRCDMEDPANFVVLPQYMADARRRIFPRFLNMASTPVTTNGVYGIIVLDYKVEVCASSEADVCVALIAILGVEFLVHTMYASSKSGDRSWFCGTLNSRSQPRLQMSIDAEIRFVFFGRAPTTTTSFTVFSIRVVKDAINTMPDGFVHLPNEHGKRARAKYQRVPRRLLVSREEGSPRDVFLATHSMIGVIKKALSFADQAVIITRFTDYMWREISWEEARAINAPISKTVAPQTPVPHTKITAQLEMSGRVSLLLGGVSNPLPNLPYCLIPLGMVNSWK